MKENMTLRQLILQTLSRGEIASMIDYLFERDSESMMKDEKNPLTRETTEESYLKVIDELLDLPPTTPTRFPLIVSAVKDDVIVPEDSSSQIPPHPDEFLSTEEYYDVSMINLDYVEPPLGADPWGGEAGEVVPDGYYNCNEEKYNKYFAFGLTPWHEIIENNVINETNLNDYEVLAEILWELTFYGWTQKDQDEFRSELDNRLAEAKKEIESGNCIRLPKQDGDKFTIVVPDCVREQFSKKKINTLAEGAD